PAEADLAPNSQIQSDDPLIVQLAREAAADAEDPVALALNLERFVQQRVRVKDFSQAFATASDVARDLTGDCTEHAVLLAALARANNIPSRVAFGMIYVPEHGGFAFHMWNELYVDDAWRPFDATLGRGGAGAAHLKLGHSNLQASGGLQSFLVVGKIMGQMDIDLIASTPPIALDRGAD